MGQEWVPIREENTVFAPAINPVELGHGFTLATSEQIGNARFYMNAFPPGRALGQTFLSTIYARGTEDQTGPIECLIIPCSAALVSGGAVVGGGGGTAVEALADPSDNKWVFFPATGTPAISCHFPINQYIQALGGKRILDLTILYSMAVDSAGTTPVPIPAPDDRGIFSVQDTSANTVGFGVPELFESLVGANRISRCELGEIDFFWSAGVSPISTSERLPWRFEGMQDFEISTTFASRINFHYTHDITEVAYLNYIAMEVLYCEEKRLIVGGKSFGESSFAAANTPYTPGANIITMRSLAQVQNTILATGDYSLVLSSANLGDAGGTAGLEDRAIALSQYPDLNALRELYPIPPHPGVQVNIPFPLEDHVGETFTEVVTHILPQLSLHTSGATLTEPHVYGRQGAAEVYGGNAATQDIYDDITGTAATYPQVRFYARRFGDTSVPLTLTGVGGLSASTVSITPAEFDALTDIIDGWKEVTLTFATPPSMGAVAGLPAWTWTSTGETKGNRWEILAACAPAVSGVPGNLLNFVPAPNQLGTATYQPVLGDTTELTWMPQGVASPYVSGATADPGCDAVLIFSQDPNPVTGVTLSQLTQTVTGLGFNCGSLPCCIPSGIGYQRITWGLPVNTGIASDDFNRVVAAGGWGTASDGHVWTTSGTAANFSVDGAEGLIAPSALNASRLAWVDVGGVDQDITVLARINDVAESGNMSIGLVGRLTDSSNYLVVEFRYSTTATELILRQRVGGVTSDLISVVPTLLPAASAWRWIRLQIQGPNMRAKVWGWGDPEPDWMITAPQGTVTITTGTNAGVIARDNTAAAAPSVFMYDQFSVAPPDYGFGGLELQRFDYLTGTFETIMLATSPTVTGFNDYEARVGIDSVYRIRNLNVYNFAGPWSTQVTGAPPVPGVTGGCDDNTGALIFTSNADQSGHSNAAYVMQWDGTPDETFDLPEGDDVVFQPMYGRDGRVAFHGTERGLETFNRTLLIHAAAIDPIRLADVKTLRDLAWADLPYICVRDELGDRWYANVRVPTVSARHNRTNYMARIGVVETTTTPFAVNP